MRKQRRNAACDRIRWWLDAGKAITSVGMHEQLTYDHKVRGLNLNFDETEEALRWMVQSGELLPVWLPLHPDYPEHKSLFWRRVQ